MLTYWQVWWLTLFSASLDRMIDQAINFVFGIQWRARVEMIGLSPGRNLLTMAITITIKLPLSLFMSRVTKNIPSFSI